MKFFSLLFITLFFLSGIVKAQTKEEMQASQARYEKLTKLCEKEPKKTGIPDVDTYVSNVYNAAIAAMATTELLQDLYYRQIGETKDGVTDVTIKKPTVEELSALSVTIAAQAITLTEASKTADKALKASKEQKNPMKAAKITSVLAFTKDAYPILVEESALQTKAIAAMIETATTAKNL